MSPHTPGPWQVDGFRAITTIAVNGYGEHTLIGGTTADEVSKPEAWANARLIAAAPELLAALEAITGYTTPFHMETDEERAAWLACEECTRRRANPFFPGDYCDNHYRALVMKYERLNEDERSYHTAHNMREIARAAVAKARGLEVQE